MQAMYERYKDRAAFFLVYIREAHPSDGRQSPDNRTSGVVFRQPRSCLERALVAGTCVADLKLSLPCLIDEMKGAVMNAYAAWPDRIYVVDTAGKLALVGGPGPRGFRPGDAEAVLKRLLAKAAPKTRPDGKTAKPAPPPPRPKR